jgi:hypothetical protein
MLTLNDLKARAHAAEAVPGNVDLGKVDYTLELDSDAVVQEALMKLSAYFGGDDERQAIRLNVQGKEVGYLMRTDLYDLVAVAEKDIGDADHAGLLGHPSAYRLIELHCPVQNCQKRKVVTSFDEGHPPKCEDHNASMEVSRP